MNRIDTFFGVTARGSTIAGECRAGLVTFLTMSYVLVVNPKIMHTHWCDKPGHETMCPSADDVVIATALSAALGSLLCGLCGHLPFVLAPGIGLSAYFSYGLVIHGAKLDKEVALATVVVSGFVILLLTLIRATSFIMRYMPETIKTSTVVGMGLLIAFVGFHSTKMVEPDKESVVRLGNLWEAPALLTMGGLILVAALSHLQVKGGILISILTVTILSWVFGVDPWPDTIARVPVIDTTPHDVIVKGFPGLTTDCVVPVMTFVLVSVLDVAGVMYGLAKMANCLEPDDSIRGGQAGFVSCGVSTVLAGILGSTPIIAGIESASGIGEGGRTGLVACVVAVLFSIAVFFAPLFGHIPPQATAPVLILIGTMMAGNAKDIDWGKLTEAVPAFLTMVVMPFTFSIPNGLGAGIASYVLLWLVTGEWRHHCRVFMLQRGYSQVQTVDAEDEADSGYVVHCDKYNSRTDIDELGFEPTPTDAYCPEDPYREEDSAALP